jgi:hypothetical protein
MGLANATPPVKEDRKPDVPMPLGIQQAEVVHTLVKATKTGKVMFSVKFADNAERSAWANLTVSPESPKAMEILGRQLNALGLEDDFLNADDTTPDDIAAVMLGKKALVTVVDEEYNGKTYRKIKWIN